MPPTPNYVNTAPYATPKAFVGKNTYCDVCDRTIPTKCWGEHSRSKKHLENNEKKLEIDAGKALTLFAKLYTSDDDTDDESATPTGNAVNKTTGGALATTPVGHGVESDDGFQIQVRPSVGASGGSDIKCFRCRSTGHIAPDCPKYLKGGHDSGCYACGEQGHQKRDCPKSNANVKCHSCGEMGHYQRSCPKDLKCNRCGFYGHRAADCLAPKTGKGRLGDPELQCYKCKNTGHIFENCPLMEGIEFDANSPMCYNCNSLGHKRDDCPLKPADGSPRTGDFNTGSYGQKRTNFQEWSNDGKKPAVSSAYGW